MNLDRLIEILLEERGERADLSDMPYTEKQKLFRAMCNIRAAKPVTEEFIALQDEYLKELSLSRGIVRAEELDYREDIALWQGDITRIDADGIVNACNSALLGCFQPLHNCIDNCIHSFAGVQVRLDCADIMKGGREENGRVKVTSAYNLPCRYIFHTVGPIVRGKVTPQNERDLRNCYLSCLNKAKELNLSHIAFCCLSTGIFGYPKQAACRLAVSTVREWLKDNNCRLKVIFNVFTDEDRGYYERELG